MGLWANNPPFLMMTKLMELYMYGLKSSFIEAPLNSCITINNKVFNEVHETKQNYMHQQGESNMHKPKVLFPKKTSSPFCLNFQKHSPHFVKHKMHKLNSIYEKTQICVNKLKIFLPLFVNHPKRGKIKQINNTDIYVIYIHEGEDAKLASLHTCIT